MKKLITAALLLAAPVTVGAISALPAQAAGTPPPKLVNCTGKGAVKPSSYVLFCGDANEALARLHWTTWTATDAAATGVAEANTCEPSCAAGKLKEYPVTVSATRVRSGHFTRLAVTFPSSHPSGFGKVQRYDVDSKGPTFA